VEESLKRELYAAGINAEYDEHAKKLLAQKIILAHILVSTVSEFAGMEPEHVVPLIEGVPEVSIVPVNPGETNSLKEDLGNGKRELCLLSPELTQKARFPMKAGLLMMFISSSGPRKKGVR